MLVCKTTVPPSLFFAIQVNGGLFMASLFQVILGATGLAGVILRFLGPLTIGSCIGILGIGLIDVTWPQCSVHWGVSSA